MSRPVGGFSDVRGPVAGEVRAANQQGALGTVAAQYRQAAEDNYWLREIVKQAFALLDESALTLSERDRVRELRAKAGALGVTL